MVTSLTRGRTKTVRRLVSFKTAADAADQLTKRSIDASPATPVPNARTGADQDKGANGWNAGVSVRNSLLNIHAIGVVRAKHGKGYFIRVHAVDAVFAPEIDEALGLVSFAARGQQSLTFRPASFDGIQVEIYALRPAMVMSRPIQPGHGIAPPSSRISTVGFFAKTQKDETVFVTCAHGLITEIPVGGPVHHLGPSGRQIACLSSHAYQDTLDVACCALITDINFDAAIPGVGRLGGIVHLDSERDAGKLVEKVGRGTGLTEGVVINTHFVVRIRDPETQSAIVLREQILVRRTRLADRKSLPIVRPGDSGSALLSTAWGEPNAAAAPHLAGVVCAGDPDGAFLYANPIRDVLPALGLASVL